jgi:hypothetical protein
VLENAAFLNAKADGPNVSFAHSFTQEVFTLFMACNTKSAVISVVTGQSHHLVCRT